MVTAQVLRLSPPTRPAPPVAQVLDLAEEKRRMRKEARQRRAFENAWREVRAMFPDVDVTKEAGAFSTLLVLTLERLSDHPDFAGEIPMVRLA